ncbi:3-isopropylmalate dehydrogenase [Fictibacillus enclensis]|uniref:3-isopropylmalate dehydrogenase n=1 Tax=Fictibacillus enclensis TaxID=1017270 RepID=A0A0V8J9D1_9BACL|nr:MULTISPECIES: 3-isopropylmalate dehydrogenase [Fictibacillus]KSU83743.1 3-isopropylmalate dehydrogenase [Fictibacillus enclensis]MDM5199981.1 3-isopropylmalate dehydrogenase [Fictibacillus enclensis]MDM5339292.1 3-isopropylmalate dehydrogenase [Fictibacillus enclensis]RXY98257.1 3-isopropylmalate dehydrogenase [Fictibacillus sp. S7]WHY70747.1 3-isopropylmalate dehydrogenase [Fictibacillus enclensis]
MEKTITVLPGDGIGPEVMKGALRVLKAVEARYGHQFNVTEMPIGGKAIDETGFPLPSETLEQCKKSDAVLLGAVGGPKWDGMEKRPEQGLLQIRKELNVFANLRPVKAFAPLGDISPLKPELIENVDLIFVRELTGGLYFAQPKGRTGNEEAVDTLYYHRNEIERVVKKAFEIAASRSGKLTSVDKANVLESSKLWREVVNEMAKSFPEVEVEHMLVDNAAMQLVRNPVQFDVIVTENMFGDILSDEASMITGSLGMLASASVSEDGQGLYEPVHGSAPDIAGKNAANPLGMVLSTAMMLRHSFHMNDEADAIEMAVQEVLNANYRTRDIESKKGRISTTDEMVDQLIYRLDENAATTTLLEVYV